MTILNQNIQSIRNKTERLRVMLNENKFDVLCFTEHWVIYDSISTINIKGYNVASVYARRESLHGGALILINNKLKCKELLNIKSLSMERNIEICAVQIPEKGCVVLCVYRPQRAMSRCLWMF